MSSIYKIDIDAVKKAINRRVSTMQSGGITDLGGAIGEYQTAYMHACLLCYPGPLSFIEDSGQMCGASLKMESNAQSTDHASLSSVLQLIEANVMPLFHVQG